MIYDFLVICGGVTGTSGAYELAAHDSVLLLEAENTAGYHATGRSAAVFPRTIGLAAKRRTGISINAPSDKLCANLPVIDLQGRARI